MVGAIHGIAWSLVQNASKSCLLLVQKTPGIRNERFLESLASNRERRDDVVEGCSTLRFRTKGVHEVADSQVARRPRDKCGLAESEIAETLAQVDRAGIPRGI